jgi:hypothetical protein
MEVCNEQGCVVCPKILSIISYSTDRAAAPHCHSGSFYVGSIVMTNHAIRASYRNLALAELISCEVFTPL